MINVSINQTINTDSILENYVFFSVCKEILNYNKINQSRLALYIFNITIHEKTAVHGFYNLNI